MENFQIYRDIQARTGGDIYIGVVGPVRTGKSTFIRRFMELVALPGMDEKMQKEVRDQLPLSGKRRCRKYRRRKRAYGENALVYKSHSISRSRQNGYRKSNPGAFHHWPCDHLRWQLRGNSKGKFRSGRGADSSRTEKTGKTFPHSGKFPAPPQGGNQTTCKGTSAEISGTCSTCKL